MHFLSRKSSTRYLFSIAAAILGVLCLIVAGILLFHRWSQTEGVARPPLASETVTVDTDTPEEKKPDASQYIVAHDQPRRITASTIGLDALIQRVGLTKKNAIAVPSNVHFAGWYTKSAKPGEEGLSIIDGHVSGRYAPGIFAKLSDLQPGNKLQVEYGDGSMRTFEVVRKKEVMVDQASGELFNKDPAIEHQMNLITCTGIYDRREDTYDKRLIVVTQRV